MTGLPVVRGIVVEPLSADAEKQLRQAGKAQVLAHLAHLMAIGKISASNAEKVFLAFLIYIENHPPKVP